MARPCGGSRSNPQHAVLTANQVSPESQGRSLKKMGDSLDLSVVINKSRTKKFTELSAVVN